MLHLYRVSLAFWWSASHSGVFCLEQWTICGAFGQPWATLYLFRLSSMCGFAGALVVSVLVVLYVCGIGIHPCEACLHVCEASLTSHVTSHTGRVKTRRDLDKRQQTFPRGFTPSGGAVHRRRVWSKGFSHSAGTLAREMSHPALITLSSFYLPQSSPKCTHQHKRRAWHAVHVHVSRGYRSRHGAAPIAWSLLTN